MLKTKVKASSVTNLTDARYFAAWGTEWLGFNFDSGSDYYIQPQVMKAIQEWVDGVQIVGEFNLQPPEEILAAVELLGLDAIQVGMFSDIGALRSNGLKAPIIQELILESSEGIDPLAEQLAQGYTAADIFLLNFDKNGIQWSALKAEDRAKLQALSREHLILLSIGLTAGELDEMLNLIHPYGISVQGGEEEKVGFKSFDELDVLFEALEITE